MCRQRPGELIVRDRNRTTQSDSKSKRRETQALEAGLWPTRLTRCESREEIHVAHYLKVCSHVDLAATQLPTHTHTPASLDTVLSAIDRRNVRPKLYHVPLNIVWVGRAGPSCFLNNAETWFECEPLCVRCDKECKRSTVEVNGPTRVRGLGHGCIFPPDPAAPHPDPGLGWLTPLTGLGLCLGSPGNSPITVTRNTEQKTKDKTMLGLGAYCIPRYIGEHPARRRRARGQAGKLAVDSQVGYHPSAGNSFLEWGAAAEQMTSGRNTSQAAKSRQLQLYPEERTKQEPEKNSVESLTRKLIYQLVRAVGNCPYHTESGVR
ncbi:hypothetical protein RRG08_019418 [Elysia crispata]|uniref:Uncharacterized protein n=1 Tax=Elysia crispata TaxID=231223 RepID=A0AAE0Z334_9GAST|nr:hypothetical protein RRG08_019418 [Elysia crispata]